MGCLRALICLILPPLAVIDRGCGQLLIVTVLWIAGWIPGVLAALFKLHSRTGRKTQARSSLIIID